MRISSFTPWLEEGSVLSTLSAAAGWLGCLEEGEGSVLSTLPAASVLTTEAASTFLSRVDSFSASFCFFSSSSFLAFFSASVRKKAFTSASLSFLGFLLLPQTNRSFVQSTVLDKPSSVAMSFSSLCLPLSANFSFLLELVVPLPRGKPLQFVVFLGAMAFCQPPFVKEACERGSPCGSPQVEKGFPLVKGSQTK